MGRCDCEDDAFTGRDMMDMPAPYASLSVANIRAVGSRPRRRRAGKRAAPVTLQLLSKREVIFDGRTNQTQSVPLPSFDTAAWGTWVLSVAVSVKTGYLAGNQLTVAVQNVEVDSSDPAKVFATTFMSVNITSSPAAPQLLSANSTAAAGSQARLLLQWSQGANAFSPPGTPVARTVLSAWITLKPKSKPPAT